MFTPVAGGRVAGGRTDPDGRYEMIFSKERDGALLGEQIVSISTFRGADPGLGVARIPERVPVKYNRRTELRVIVEPGSNTIDFPLKSVGEIFEPSDSLNE